MAEGHREEYIAERVMPYVPHQTMTMGEEELTSHISKLNSPLSALDQSSYACISVDFSGWCTSMSWELTQGVFQELDNLFGFSYVYTYSHIFPLESILLFQDRFNPPPSDELGLPCHGGSCFKSPWSWMEGMRQKGWTLVTIYIILHVAWVLDTTAQLIGQGDNQVIMLQIPSSKDLMRMGYDSSDLFVSTFIQKLSDMSSMGGLIVKTNETWFSKHMFEYSRKYFYAGAQVTSALKRVSRISSEANQTIPTLNTTLSGVYSTGAAAALEDHTPYGAYFCSTFEAGYLLSNHHPSLLLMTKNRLRYILQVTRVLGGYPISLFSEFLTRSTQDPLSNSLHTLKHLLCAIPESSGWSTMIRRLTPDLSMLLMDPVSLPLRLPSQPENVIKGVIPDNLPFFVVNEKIRPYFSSEVSLLEKDLVNDITSIRPFNPRLASRLYSCSSLGYREKLLGKFSSTASILRLALSQWTSELDILRSISIMEKSFFKFVTSSRPFPFSSSWDCSTHLAQHLRCEWWGLPIEGITVPCNAELIHVSKWNSDVAMSRSFVMSFKCNPDTNPFFSRSGRPYIGSSTKKRVKRAPLQVLEIGSRVSTLKDLVEIWQWLGSSPSLQDFIEILIREKTSIPIKQLLDSTNRVYSGSISHRMPCPLLRSGGLHNSCINFASHLIINTDTATDFAKSRLDYNLCFQTLMLTGISQLQSNYWINNTNEDGVYSISLVCNNCIYELREDIYQIGPTTRYAGYEDPDRIHALTYREIGNPASLRVCEEVDSRFAYSYNVGRLVYFQWREWQTRSRIKLSVNTPVSRDVTPSYINYSEFIHADLRAVIRGFVIYYLSVDYNARFLHVPSYHEVVHPPFMTPLDYIINSALKCNKLDDLIVRNRYSTEDNDYHLMRESLYQRLCKESEFVTEQVASLTLYHHGEDSESVVLSLLNFKRSGMGLEELRVPHLKDVPLPVRNSVQYPRCLPSDEEVVYHIRNLSIDSVPDFTVSKFDWDITHSNHGGKVPPSCIEKYMWISPHIQRILLSDQILSIPEGKKLLVIDDEEGYTASIIMHRLKCSKFSVLWRNPSSESFCRWPVYVSGDPHLTNFDYEMYKRFMPNYPQSLSSAHKNSLEEEGLVHFLRLRLKELSVSLYY